MTNRPDYEIKVESDDGMVGSLVSDTEFRHEHIWRFSYRKRGTKKWKRHMIELTSEIKLCQLQEVAAKCEEL